jgi:hypothetical protein
LKQGGSGLDPTWRDFTGCFARIAEAVRGLNADEALIEGEAVVFRDDGRSYFIARASSASAFLFLSDSNFGFYDC